MSVKNIGVTNVVFLFAVMLTTLIAIAVFERPRSVVIMEPWWENGIVSETVAGCAVNRSKKQCWEEIKCPNVQMPSDRQRN
jgi:hypothetical protein